MFNHLYGNVVKKELNFASVLHNNFDEGRLLGLLIDKVEVQKELSVANAKKVLYALVDAQFE